jgi:uncharacterized protein YggE
VPVPTLLVTGSAERLVTPDRVVVTVRVQTAVLPTPQEALATAADARRRLLDHLGRELPWAAVTDGRITTRQEGREVTEDRPGGTETRWEVAGHTGLAAIAVEGQAARAGEIVASAGAHPDAALVRPEFRVGPALGRRVRDELEQEAVRDALARAQGLAAAAGMVVDGVLSIGERPPPVPRDEPTVLMQRSIAAPELEEALGELRPEPEPRAAEVPVRLALRAAGEPA